jgi:Fe-S cluster biogenesis protein NfuA/nitrite reductase/ring-hydroxylating ferredoxin subunit
MSATTTDATPVELLAGRVDRAVAAARQLDDAARDVALEVKDATEAFHREALVTIVQHLKADPRGKELLFELVDDEAVYGLLTLHGIVRTPPLLRAQQALASVRPYLESHGGDVELVDIDDGVAKVRLLGSCNGCSMSSQTLTNAVQTALVDNVPEIAGIEVVPTEPEPALIPPESLFRRPGGDAATNGVNGTSPGAVASAPAAAQHDPMATGRDGWVRGPALLELPDPGLVRADIDGNSFIVVRDGGVITAFRNECGHLGLELDDAEVGRGRVVCEHHGFQFDVMTGAGLTDPGAGLDPIPSRVEGVHVWLRPPEHR